MKPAGSTDSREEFHDPFLLRFSLSWNVMAVSQVREYMHKLSQLRSRTSFLTFQFARNTALRRAHQGTHRAADRAARAAPSQPPSRPFPGTASVGCLTT